MNIAIIGGGISGLTCAHLLNRRHDITVFEAGARVGGHTHTVDVSVEGQHYKLDTGFIAFNDRLYPNFIRLLGQLGVAFKPTEMSFSVSDPDSGFEYNAYTSLFAQRRHLLSSGFWDLRRDIARFHQEAQLDLAAGHISADTTLNDYLQAGGYSERFILHYLVPMGAAVWSMPMADMLGFPVHAFLRFFLGHGLRPTSSDPQWYVIEGSSSAYIAPLISSFSEKIRLNCAVTRVERDAHGVRVHSAAGSERFDKVVFACHSDQALKLLADPDKAEQSILGALPYSENEVVLHTDTRLLPSRKSAWASLNYRLSGAGHTRATVTYNLSKLQGIRSDRTFCLSLNQSAGIEPSTVLGRFNYAHPQLSLKAVAAQNRWEEINGAHHTFYCGAYWASGFHEDGVVSALRVAQAFGEVL